MDIFTSLKWTCASDQARLCDTDMDSLVYAAPEHKADREIMQHCDFGRTD